jgi:putative transposase
MGAGSALLVVRPETLTRWHRAGFRLLWRWKSRPGRPQIPQELRELIRRMERESSVGSRTDRERIAAETRPSGLAAHGAKVSAATAAG